VSKAGRSGKEKSKKPGTGAGATATGNGAGSNLFLTAAEQRVAEKKAEKMEKDETYSFLREEALKDVCIYLFQFPSLPLFSSTLGTWFLILSVTERRRTSRPARI
jgi:hypothetical protein